MKTLEQRCRDAGVKTYKELSGSGVLAGLDRGYSADTYNAACEQFLPIIEQKDAEIADLYSGKRGACATCEPVGELNQKLVAEIAEISEGRKKQHATDIERIKEKDAEIADLKNENAKMRMMFDLDYGESYKAYLAEYEASELTPKEAFIFQMLNHVTVQLNARIKELEAIKQERER